MAGALALVLAGFGSAYVGGQTDGNTLQASNYQTISAAYTGSEGTAPDAGDVDITRSFDRELLAQQAADQADQLVTVQAELASRAQDQADQLTEEKANQWVIPVVGYNLTARFGQRSSLWSSGAHTGVDFAGPSGSTIVSIAAGTVKSAGYEGAYGNRTVITLEDGTEVWYAHQSRIAVNPGDVVEPGQTIGYTGSTGNVTGPHLHLELHPGGGAAIDPLPVLQDHGVNP